MELLNKLFEEAFGRNKGINMKIVGAVIFILVIIFISFLAIMSFLMADDATPKVFYTVLTIIAIVIFCKVFFSRTPEQKIKYYQQQIEKLQ